jgi:hypothetical protein
MYSCVFCSSSLDRWHDVVTDEVGRKYNVIELVEDHNSLFRSLCHVFWYEICVDRAMSQWFNRCFPKGFRQFKRQTKSLVKSVGRS